MSFNFAELQQKANRVIHNSDEFVRKWVEFMSAPAGNINLEYYDQNGNLRTVSFSNRNKLVQDFIANTSRVMFKTVYVDQVNGDDGNDGSANAPFRTLQKAVDSVPVGGYGLIYLKAGQTFQLTKDLKIVRKYIELRKWGANTGLNPKITTSIYEYNNYERIHIFLLDDAHLVLWEIDFETPNRVNTSIPQASYGLFYLIKNSTVDFFSGTGVVKDWPFIIVKGWTAFSLGNINIFQYSVNPRFTVRRGTPLVNFYSSPAKFYIYVGKIPVDENGSSLTWNDVIAGIVKDANGIPRNVISNIIL